MLHVVEEYPQKENIGNLVINVFAGNLRIQLLPFTLASKNPNLSRIRVFR